MGLGTVKIFVISILSIAILGMAVMIVLGSISTSDISRKTSTLGANNETLAAVNETVVSLSASTQPSVSCTISQVNNRSSNDAINSGNYTLGTNGCTISYTTGIGDPDGFNNSAWNVTYTYSFREDIGVGNITANVSGGITTFFSNAPTFFTLLAIAVILLIISLVIIAVNRFGDLSGSSNSSFDV